MSNGASLHGGNGQGNYKFLFLGEHVVCLRWLILTISGASI